MTAGNVNFVGDAHASDPTLAVSVAAGASATLNVSQTFSSLSVAGTARLPASGSDKTLVMNALSVTGSGKLDLADNALVLQHANLSAAQAALAGVTARVKNAFNEFAWNQPGLTSSTVQTDIASGVPSGLGVLLNNDGSGNALFYGDGTALPKFQGVAVDAHSVIIKSTLLGDGDLNGTVDSFDFSLFQAGYSGAVPNISFAFGDYNYDGLIDSADFSLFQAGYAIV